LSKPNVSGVRPWTRLLGPAARLYASASLRRVKELLPEIQRWRERGDRVAVATVVASRRSAPRPVGSKLVVSERGEIAGSVSGGCVESDVCEAAQEVLRSGRPRLLSYGIADELAFSVGLPCGGEIDVFVEPLE
jgi:xanthine/CO dehydrogenase XdhC/CoxF family maturation factor